MTTGAESDALAEGYSALRAGRAQDARKIFATAVAIHGSAEAHEGLGWAALALDDGASTIVARQTAYRLYRAAEAPVSAARMAMWLAKDHDDFRGEAALANGWLALARRLLEDQPTVPEHGWLLILESWGTTASERDPEIVADGARKAIAVARQCGDRDLELLGIGFEGLALVDAGRVEKGMARLDEAAAAATVGEFDEPLWSLVIFCLLIFACAKVRDFARAAEWCETMRDLADRMRHTGSQGVCRTHYGAVLTQCGNWDRAEETLANAVRYFEASWPPYRAEALADLAELRRRQGRLGEAGELLDRAASVPRAALVRARCALDVGQSENAVDTTERYLRRFPETSAMHRVEGLDVLVRAAVAAGLTARAETALAELEAIVRRVATPPLLGMANAARATLAAATGRTEDARAGFEDAIDLYARAGLTFDAAVARVDLAELLSALNRGDAARAEIASALAVFDTLGATHLARRAKALDSRFARAMHSERAGESDHRLTPRQVEVLRLVAEGLTNREIATELALSEKTVDRHLSNVFDRLGVSSRAAAVALALEYDVI